jgi:hypothetical protein
MHIIVRFSRQHFLVRSAEFCGRFIAFPVSVSAKNFAPDAMADDIFDFTIGARCRLSRLGVARNPRTTMRAGTIVGRGRSTSSVRVLFDGYSRPVSLHQKDVELIYAEPEAPAPQRPRDVADRLLELRDLRKLSDDESLRETFTLPLHAARLKARQILNAYPRSGYTAVVESWRQLPDGHIEFTMRRLPTN